MTNIYGIVHDCNFPTNSGKLKYVMNFNDFGIQMQKKSKVKQLLFSYLQKAGKLDYSPTETFGFWFN